MVKNNKRFAFEEKLDLESVLGRDDDIGSLSQSCLEDNGKVNQYHLHSILVHTGNMEYGHYYAFIRPGLEDRWYEFNDARVTEISKQHAFG